MSQHGSRFSQSATPQNSGRGDLSIQVHPHWRNIMTQLKLTLLAALMCVSTLAFADHDKDHDAKHQDMSVMDTNGDGLISRDEFMNFQAAHWDKMTKNKDGTVAMKDMHHMHHDMMKKGCEDMKEKKDN
jgi:ABC-type nickel/cobalt efflux system permease component RcnA